MGANGYLSMNLRATHMTLPVLATGAGNTIMDFHLVSATDNLSQLKLEHCLAKKILFEHTEVLPSSYYSTPDSAFNLTDPTWLNGVAIYWAGFFVHNSQSAQELFLPGKRIKFADGTIKTIISLNPQGSFLEIYLDGSPLNGAIVGFPNKFQVLEVLEDPPSNTPYNLTDNNWINGVAIRWAGFFVSASQQNQAEFSPGGEISFADGSVRIINKVEISGIYLNIYLDGQPLNGAVVGYPNTFKVTQ